MNEEARGFTTMAFGDGSQDEEGGEPDVLDERLGTEA